MLSWAAYNKTDISNRSGYADGARDGYLLISNSAQIAAGVYNEYNITVDGQSDVGEIADGFVISGATLEANSDYVFSVQLSFDTAPTPAAQSPAIPAPNAPRSFGENSNDNSFADAQFYAVSNGTSNRSSWHSYSELA